jgi:hypothetical protein
MIILVGLHIGSDWNDAGINSALITLDNKAIKHILKLAKRAKDGQTVLEYDYTPELGTSQVDLQNESSYRDVAVLSAMMGDNEVFTSKQSDDNDDPIRTECVQLHVDKTDFWWEGLFKHTDVHWETRMIPLSFLPQDLKPVEKDMNAIHEKIAAGMNSGLNAREIEATFHRHVTKAQLIRCLCELIERRY